MSYWQEQFKTISLDQFKGKYVVLFWYPCDFTFVCPTEIIQFSDMAGDFEKAKCQVIGASVDSHFAHKEWTKKDRKKGREEREERGQRLVPEAPQAGASVFPVKGQREPLREHGCAGTFGLELAHSQN